MTTTISKLSVALTARTDKFNKNMKKSQTRLEMFKGKASAAGKAMALMGGIAGGVASAGMAKLTKDSLSNIDATAKLSDRIGIATEKLVGLEHAAAINGATAKDLQTGLQRMARSIGDAGDGSADAVRAFEALGVRYSDLIDQSPEEQFLTLADALKDIDNASTRVDLAQTIFGRGGANLLNLMMQGSDAIRLLQSDAEKLGITFSRFEAAKVEAANDAVTRLGASLRGVGNEAAIGLSPAIESAASALTRLINGNDLEGFFSSVGDIGVSVFDELAQAGTSSANAIRFVRIEMLKLQRDAEAVPNDVLATASGLAGSFVPGDSAAGFSGLSQALAGGSFARTAQLDNQIADIEKDIVDALRVVESSSRTQRIAQRTRSFADVETSAESTASAVSMIDRELQKVLDDVARLKEAGKSPFERYTEDIEVLSKALEDGIITLEQFQDAQNTLQARFPEPDEQEAERFDPGTFRNVQLENIALNGFAQQQTAAQEVSDPQLQETNDTLGEIRDLMADGRGAVLV